MIPKTLHFCFGLSKDFGGKPWSLVHYVCVKSAIERIKPDKVFIYYQYEPRGVWWKLIKPHITPIKIKAPYFVFDRPLFHPAHRADVIRLQKLIEHGGIYLDCDVFVHKSFDDILNKSVVLGLEEQDARPGLCNAVIMAEPQSLFLKRWYEEYRHFRSKGRDEFWNEHSVLVPHSLMQTYPDEVHVLPGNAFFWPTWRPDHLALLFSSERIRDVRGTYANHLWENMAWSHLHDLTPGQVRSHDSAFHLWAREFVEKLPDDYGKASSSTMLIRKLRRLARVSIDKINGISKSVADTLLGLIIFPSRNREKTFRDVYRHNKWGTDNISAFFSGVGSRGAPVSTYVENILPILSELGKEKLRVVDLGCGDFVVGKELLKNKPKIQYIGCDIVPEIISSHINNHASENVSFQHIDIVSQELPDGEVCLVRQVFQHLPNDDITAVLKKLSKYKRVIITEAQPFEKVGAPNPDKKVGADIRFDWKTGRGRGIELNLPPWNLLIEEICRVTGSEGDRENIITYMVSGFERGGLANS